MHKNSLLALSSSQVLPYDFTQLEITSPVAHVLLFPSFPQSPRGSKSTAAAGQAKPWAALAHQPASGSGQPETASGSVLEQSKQVWLVPFNANISYSIVWLRVFLCSITSN